MNNALHIEILALKVLPMWKYSICFFMIYHIDNGILWVCEFRTISLEHSSHHVTSRLHSLMQGPGSRYSAYILMLLPVGFHTGVLLIAYILLVSSVLISQVSVKKDNGKTTMVPVFQSLETISGEV